MNNFNDEAGYKSYFQSIANSHVDIDAFLFGNSKRTHEAQRSEASQGYTLWLDYYPPLRTAGSDDNYLGVIKAQFTVMKPVSEREDDNDEMNAIAKGAEDIVQQILAKIFTDYHAGLINDENAPLWSTVQLGRMEVTMFGGSKYDGCAAELDIQVPMKMQYNEAKWV